MRSKPWVAAYTSLFLVAGALAWTGFARSCANLNDGYLIQGCGHDNIWTQGSSHLLQFLMISGLVTVVGTAISLIRGRRPTTSSFVIWGTTGLLELAIPASWYTPILLTEALLFVSALAVVVALPAGVSVAKLRPALSNSPASSLRLPGSDTLLFLRSPHDRAGGFDRDTW